MLSNAKKLCFANRYAAVWVSLDFKRHAFFPAEGLKPPVFHKYEALSIYAAVHGGIAPLWTSPMQLASFCF